MSAVLAHNWAYSEESPRMARSRAEACWHRRVPNTLAGAALLLATVAHAQDGAGNPEAQQLMLQWQASNVDCRSQSASALAAIAACERRDTVSKVLAQLSYCYSVNEKSGPAVWTPCGGGAGRPSSQAVQDAAAARTTEHFQRMGGVFVLPARINGTSKAYFIVDSGAANIQIPQEVADEMKRNGTLTDADFLGQQRFTLANGSGLQQQIFRLKSLQIGERTMENVLAAVGAPKSRALLGQSFLRRLSWWKIDNVRNAIEFEFTGAF
jgi:clan AA aspartic protease (TIGR02281 family)